MRIRTEINHTLHPVPFMGTDHHSHRIELRMEDVFAVTQVPDPLINQQRDHDI